ncbi:LuxR C-terminal-related transcriptional regulator [Crossiella sp. CA198]|uniref:LuxR C-terminal-related transcriptional regulator n=1 Tax=Crossiella sp. CA198 TaxID=3455607 RepID=UPI003F8CF49E
MSAPRHGRLLAEPHIAVLRLVADGLTNAEIAQRLHIAPDTVKSRIVTILDRLGVRTRAAAALKAFHLGLLGVVPVPLLPPDTVTASGLAVFGPVVCDRGRDDAPISTATGIWISATEATRQAAALFSAVHYAQGGHQ